MSQRELDIGLLIVNHNGIAIKRTARVEDKTLGIHIFKLACPVLHTIR